MVNALTFAKRHKVAKSTHESMATNVLCDVESFEVEAGLAKVEFMPQCFETREEIVDVELKVV
jgi:hypothetical protein